MLKIRESVLIKIFVYAVYQTVNVHCAKGRLGHFGGIMHCAYAIYISLHFDFLFDP